MTDTGVHQITVTGIGAVPATVTDLGGGRPVLLLHGGAGPASLAAFADRLVSTNSMRVLTPTHPGFDGTPRPYGVDSIATLARLYTLLLDQLDLTDVVVIGNSIGGWIAAEIALLHPQRVSGVILIGATGLQMDAHPVADFFSLTMDQVADLSYADPDAFRIDVSTLSDARKAMMATNRVTLEVYGGHSMTDPTLLGRLSSISVPTLAIGAPRIASSRPTTAAPTPPPSLGRASS